MSEPHDQAQPTYRHDLGNGLVLRWSTSEDTEPIAQLLSLVFRPSAEAPPNEIIKARVRLLMSGYDPLMGSGDFVVVEDTTHVPHPLVAASCLWHHTWEFAGIPLGVGRPEYVVVDPAYRHRGLIRAIMALLHARSVAEGDHLQVITGIYSFYRQFGYEYALDLDGARIVNLTQIPAIKAGNESSYVMRNATVDDIPHLLALHTRRRQGTLLWSALSAEHWRYQIVELAELGAPNKRSTLKMLTDRDGMVIGYLEVEMQRFSTKLVIYAFETVHGVNLRTIVLALLPALALYGQTVLNSENADPCQALKFQLGRDHPVYDLLDTELAPAIEPPYAWYIRVSDTMNFLRLITPVLEQRLADSIMARYAGEIKLDWYRGGVHLVFSDGKLTTIAPWQAPLYGEEANAGCPSLIFTQLLLGYRSLDELCHIYPDVWTNDEVRLVLNILFPKQPSYVLS